MSYFTQYSLDLLLPASESLIQFVGLLKGTTSALEVSGGSYSRKGITFGTASNNTTGNSSLIDFGTATADWGQILCLGGFDAVSAGNLTWICALDTSYFVKNGDRLTFPINSIRLTIS
jgi:hypothetical protein